MTGFDPDVRRCRNVVSLCGVFPMVLTWAWCRAIMVGDSRLSKMSGFDGIVERSRIIFGCRRCLVENERDRQVSQGQKTLE